MLHALRHRRELLRRLAPGVFGPWNRPAVAAGYAAQSDGVSRAHLRYVPDLGLEVADGGLGMVGAPGRFPLAEPSTFAKIVKTRDPTPFVGYAPVPVVGWPTS